MDVYSLVCPLTNSFLLGFISYKHMKLFWVKLKVLVVRLLIVLWSAFIIEKVNAVEFLADQVGNCQFSERCK